MRTKNLNLKKKIAFIASVAMIATTAAYLPAEVTQNIFNSSITVEASTQAINTAYTEIYVTDGGTNVLWKDDTGATEWHPTGWTATGTFAKVDLADTDYSDSPYTALKASAVNAIKVPFGTDTIGIKVDATGSGYAAKDGVDEIKTTYKSGKFSFGANDKFTATKATVEDKVLSLNGITLTMASANTDANKQKINTFIAYVQVNGKFLAHSATAAKPYKLFDSIAAVKANTDGYKAVVLNNIDTTSGTDATYISKHKDYAEYCGTSHLTSTSTASYEDEFTFNSTNGALMIPASVLTEETNKVSIKVVPNSASATNADPAELPGAVKSATDTITVELDKHGHGKVPANTSKIEVQGDTYKKVSSGTGYAYKGDYEYLDLSGLKVSVLAAGTDKPGLGTIKTDKALSGGVFTDISNTVNDAGEPAKYSDNENKDYLYRYVQSGKTYARNFVATLAATAEPGDKIVVDLDLKSNWTTPATSNGKITLTMDENGVAQSKVITVTNSSTGVSESYIFTVLNADLAGKTEFDKIKIGNVAGTTATTGEDFDTLINATYGRIKVKTEQVQKNINGKNQFVQYYTVYTNDDTKTITNGIQLDFTGLAATGIQDPAAASVTAKKHDNSGNATTLAKKSTLHFADDLSDTAQVAIANAADNAIESNIIELDENTWIDVKNNKLVLKPGTGNSANVESPVMFLNDANATGYFQVKFTNEYEVKLNDDNTETENDGTVSVKGVTFNKKPADAVKGGNTFQGWYVNSTGSGSYEATVATVPTPTTGWSEVFSATSSLQQDSAYAHITPFTVLNAYYKANGYYVVYDANGGKYVDSGSTFAGAYSTVEVDADDEKIVTVAKDRTKRTANGSEVNAVLSNAISNYIQKPGFTFKGWALSANATDKVTDEAYKAGRPSTDNGEVKLYAVWEANDITVNFSNIDFDAKGLSKSGVNKSDFLTSATSGFNSQEDKAATFTAGKAFGTLPTPTLKGYTFDGWYRMKITKNSKDEKVYTASKVTDKTVIESKFLDGYFDNATSDEITLYAKFKQNTYSVTTDLGSGKYEWTNTTGLTDKQKEDGPSDIVTYKYYAASDSASTSGSAHFFDANDEDITAYLTKTTVVSGSGSYYKFKGFTINNATTKVLPEKLSTALGNYTTLSDITLKAQYEETTENANGSIYFDPNEGGFYEVTVGTLSDPKTLVPSKNIWDTSDEVADGESVSSYVTIKDNTIVKTSGNYYVARPGYKFGGWYEDAECTKAFDFASAKYEGGKELKAYAKWEPESNQRYVLHYTLIDKNGVEVTFSQNDTDKPADYTGGAYGGYYRIPNDTHYNFTATIMGKAGSVVKAADKTFEYKGIKYVFDKAASADSISEKELKVAYLSGGGTGLDAGKFIIDPSKYTVIQGYYVQEGYETKAELEAPTDVKYANGKLTWTGCDAADHYNIKKVYADGTIAYVSAGKNTSITLAAANQDYTAYVIAVDATNKSKTSAAGAKVAASTKALGVVTDAKYNAATKTVSWTAVNNAVKYNVCKMVNGKKYWVSAGDKTSVTFSADTAAFNFYVVAVDKDGKTTTGTLKATPAMATNVKVASNKKTVSWTAAAGAKYYKIGKVSKDGTKVAWNKNKFTNTMGSFAYACTKGQKVVVLSVFDDAGKQTTRSATITVK